MQNETVLDKSFKKAGSENAKLSKEHGFILKENVMLSSGVIFAKGCATQANSLSLDHSCFSHLFAISQIVLQTKSQLLLPCISGLLPATSKIFKIIWVSILFEDLQNMVADVIHS